MPLRKSKATKTKEAVTDQVSDRTDDLVAALDAAKEALARASAAASRKGAELGKEASKAADKAADKLMPERARQRRREATRRRNKRLLAGTAILAGLGVLAGRLVGGKGGELRESMERQPGTPADDAPRWDRPADPGPGASAEVTQLHTNGAGGDPARTPPS
jgi:ferric-dicitrate binding protein FerR (iron transport regulator)